MGFLLRNGGDGMSGEAATREDISVAPPEDEAREMMGQADILVFLSAQGIEPLGEWRPGEALLYVIEDAYRTDTHVYRDLPRRLRPSVARLDNPDSVHSGDRSVDRHGVWTELFKIVNESGGQVDYYAIDPDTHAVTFIRSSPSKRAKDYPYVAPGNLLFRAHDALFPKQVTR
jgi:hypothetical protein